MNESPDALVRFHFDAAPLRGAHVCLDETFARTARDHDYPAPVARLLGELQTATALLASTIKSAGTLTLQVRGSGPLSVAMAESLDGTGLRGIARLRGRIEPGNLAQNDFGALLGDGDLAITLRPPGSEPYQGIVSVDHGRLEWAIEDYFQRSEQLDTRIWLACDPAAGRARGLLLQRLPSQGDAEIRADLDAETWADATRAAAALEPSTLLARPAHALLLGLFGPATVRTFTPVPLTFHCSCSERRSAGALAIMGEEEVRAILREEGEVRVECEFCKAAYVYADADIDRLFDGH